MYEYLSLRVAGWISAIGRVGQFVADVARGLREVRSWAGLAGVQMRRIGVQSLPLALIIAVFTGVVLSLQAAYSLAGATPRYFVGTLVEKTVLMELAPVLTGLALAGRVGANIAAELGTMRVTEQIDALESLGRSPISHLVIPRVVAGTLMLPILVLFADMTGIFFGWAAARQSLQITNADFVFGARYFFQPYDLWYSLIKSLFFGLAVTVVPCYMGFSTQKGAEGVGRATTTAVVVASVLILALDAFLSQVLLL